MTVTSKNMLIAGGLGALLLALSVAAVCDGYRSGPLPPAPPEYSQGTPPDYSFPPEEAEGPVPPGFSSWAEFQDWTFDLLYYPDGRARNQGGGSGGEGTAALGNGLPPPGLLTMPDGSTAIWLGEEPEGYGSVNLPNSVVVCELAFGADGHPTGCVEGTIIAEVPLP